MKQSSVESFKKWLSDISWSSLREALYFELDEKEQSLFQEMLEKQAPPPTPIHPRAIPYNKCQSDASDGRDPVEKRRRDIRSRQRWFRFVLAEPDRRVLQARNFEGDPSQRCLHRLTMGTTREQIDSDRALQDGTVAVFGQNGRLGYRYTGKRTNGGESDAQQKRSFLRIIKVASRGHFASVPLTTRKTWLEVPHRHHMPHGRWYPLSMYLACRFEVAMWYVYRGSKQAIYRTLFSEMNTVLDKALWSTVSVAVSQVISESVLCDVRTDRILDSFIWRLLECAPNRRSGTTRGILLPGDVLLGLCEIALEDMPDPRVLQMKRSICSKISQQFAEQAVASLLIGLENTESDEHCNGQALKRKGRNKRRGRNAKLRVDDRKMDSTSSSESEPDNGESDNESPQHLGTLLTSETPPREHNRNVVFILSILDDLVADVFTRLDTRTMAPEKPGTVLDASPAAPAEITTASSGVPVSEQIPLLTPTVDRSALRNENGKGDIPSGMASSTASANYAAQDNGSDHGVLLVALPGGLSSQGDHSEERLLDRTRPSAAPKFPDAISTQAMVWEVSDAALGDWGRVQGFMSREQSMFTGLFPQYDGIVPCPRAGIGLAIDDGQLNGRPVDAFTSCDKTSAHVLEDGVPSVSIGFDIDKTSAASNTPREPPSSTSKATEALELPSAVRSLCAPAVSVAARRPTGMLAKVVPVNIGDSSSEKIRVKLTRNASYRSSISRIGKSRDDHDIQRQRRSIDALSSYRLVLVKNTKDKAKDDTDVRATLALKYRAGLRSAGTPSGSSRRSSFKTGISVTNSESSPGPPSHVNFDNSRESRDLCARSETLEFNTGIDHWIDRPSESFDEDGDNDTTAKDETTTITSAPSQHEPEEMARLREERNAYRDLCLTLGAEVAKLTNLIASQRVSSSTSVNLRGPYQPNLAEPIFDPESVAHGFLSSRARTMVAMSDAGIRAEHESLASGDNGAVIRPGAGMTESDWSVDQASAAIQSTQFQLPSLINRSRALSEPSSRTGMQSRLAQDIWMFVETTHAQLRKQIPLRQGAVEKMVRLVNTLWPRAQVKLYGSHVTGVCLPSSDVDFIICLPAVHKNAVAVAPGVLEGRNAINESSQKLLYRKLKAEPWIDPRSIKLIERTLVPVIKVSTRETKGRALQLDITFDAPGHHGLEAVDLVRQIMEELPMIRPIVLVLKQILITRSLLTAYTGGLSSYCLFLMVARYLQEQPSVYSDVGALLIGFLDFFGNHFDPRTTGISVCRREYFPRPNYSASRFQPRPQPSSAQAAWQTTAFMNHGNGSTQFYRRNSFSDKGNAEAMGPGPPTMAQRPHQLHHGLPRQAPSPQIYLQDGTLTDNTQFEHRISYNFDPLWVEDPLNDSNNVGRNAFRYLQVQRAFSDAHRALVAALEWEVPSATDPDIDSEYPLLKCLLHSEDMVFDL